MTILINDQFVCRVIYIDDQSNSVNLLKVIVQKKRFSWEAMTDAFLETLS